MWLKNREQVPTLSDEAIAERAFAIWHARGCPEGDGQDDWQAAKAQLIAEAAQRRRPLLRLFSRRRDRAALL